MGDESDDLPTGNADERELYLDWLRYLRGAVLRKVAGLDDEQALAARRRADPPGRRTDQRPRNRGSRRSRAACPYSLKSSERLDTSMAQPSSAR